MPLDDIYRAWKSGLARAHPYGDRLGPPLLLSMTADYQHAARRVLVIGQETFGWQWTAQLTQSYPAYPHDWPFEPICSWNDFVDNDCGVDALLWAYEQFAFGLRQPHTHRSPFWSAFREIQAWSAVGVMWTNLIRSDFENASILAAPLIIQEFLHAQETDLLKREIECLKPDVCVFFTGPNYDHYIDRKWPGCQRLPVGQAPLRELARLSHPELPYACFRTYHPAYLRRTHRWPWIDVIRETVDAYSG